MVIRKNPAQHMKELKTWLCETEHLELEEMSSFFTARVDGYEDHMSTWKNAYQRFAQLLPEGCETVLDLGCGTGLELDECFLRFPNLKVTGVDLCQEMLEKLRQKHGKRNLQTVCTDYFCFDMEENKWDAVLSFESLHHFFPERKQQLYDKIYRSLKPGALFLLGDYIACCDEEETLLQSAYLQKRKQSAVPEQQLVHFDIPLTLEHEMQLLKRAGFSKVTAVDSIEGATLLTAQK